MPPFTLWPLIWFGFVPVVVAQHRVLPERWSGIAMGVGVGAYLAGQFSVGLAQGHVAVVFQLMPLYMVFVVWALAWRTARFHRQTAYRWIAVATPIGWVALDFAPLSGNATLGGTFSNPAYAMWRHPGFLQPLGVFSIYGLELLVLLSNWAIAAVVIAMIDRRRGGDAHGPIVRLAAARTAAIGVAVAILAWGVSERSHDPNAAVHGHGRRGAAGQGPHQGPGAPARHRADTRRGGEGRTARGLARGRAQLRAPEEPYGTARGAREIDEHPPRDRLRPQDVARPSQRSNPADTRGSLPRPLREGTSRHVRRRLQRYRRRVPRVLDSARQDRHHHLLRPRLHRHRAPHGTRWRADHRHAVERCPDPLEDPLHAPRVPSHREPRLDDQSR